MKAALVRTGLRSRVPKPLPHTKGLLGFLELVSDIERPTDWEGMDMRIPTLITLCVAAVTLAGCFEGPAGHRRDRPVQQERMGLPAWRARKEAPAQLVLPAQSVLLDLPVRRVTRENLAINKNPTAKAAGGIRPVALERAYKNRPRHAYQPPWAAKTLAVATTRLRRPFFSDQRTVVTSPLAGAAARLACLASNSPSCRAGIFRAIARRATPREIV